MMNLDHDSCLNFDHVKDCIQKMNLNLSQLGDVQVRQIFDSLDGDGNSLMDKSEMAEFLQLVLQREYQM